MEQTIQTQPLVARRATVTLVRAADGQEVSYAKVRFVFRDGMARAFDANGNLLALDEGTLAQTAAKPRAWTFTGSTYTWTIVEPKGCGCGGT